MSSRSGGVSRTYTEEGERWLEVSPGHSISERWLRERVPDLYAEWWAAAGAAQRDQVALAIEDRLEKLEVEPSWRPAVTDLVADVTLEERLSAHETAADRLSMLDLDNPTRPSMHLAFQNAGDRLRDAVAAMPNGPDRELLTRLLKADLVADQPVIEAVCGYAVHVDRMAVAALASVAAQSDEPLSVSADAVRMEMIAENPHAALRADVLTAVAAAGQDLAQLQEQAARHGVELARAVPALPPASELYARHAAAIDARLDREIGAGGFTDLPSYIAAWRTARPASGNLHDIEQAIVEHIVSDIIAETDPSGHDTSSAEQMWQRAADRVVLREWSTAVESTDLAPVSADPTRGPERQLELGLHVDDAVVDVEHDIDQEAG